MTITFEQATWAVGIVGSLGVWSWWLVAFVTRRHAEVTAAIQAARNETAVAAAATTAGITAIQVTQKHQHEMNEIKLDHLSRRMGQVETVVGSITKVVIFPEGQKS